MTEEHLNRMDIARHLLSEPGAEVAGELIAEVRRRRAELESLLKGRQLCARHPEVNYKVHWGCPECLRELREEREGWRKAWGVLSDGMSAPDDIEIYEGAESDRGPNETLVEVLWRPVENSTAEEFLG